MTSGDTTPPGEVERLAPDGLRGWVRRGADGEYPLVDLVIQGRKVRSLRVVRDLDEERGMFKIGLAESLMRYVPGPEAIVLSVDGTPLPVAETTLGAREDALDRAALDARFTSGHFVTKFGGLRLPLDLDLDWQERTFAHYERCRALMRELFDHDLHVAYGTLLGLEREGGFISSDDDFDTTYHSRRTTVRGVRAELFDIVTTLAARGEDVQLSGRKFVHWYSDRGAKLDVFPAWTRGEDYFQTHVLGGPYAEVFARGYHERELKGRTVSAPVDAAGALAATYGPGWRTPDPLFQWSIQPAARRAMRAVRVTPGQMSLLQWERHYACGEAPEDGPSELARFAAAHRNARTVGVIDLGCGDGRDTLTVAGELPALGIDGSRAAVEKAERRAGREGVRFARADVGHAKALRALLTPLTARGPVLVYARRLLDSVEEATEVALVRTLRRVLAPGSLVVLEVTTHEREPGPLGTPLHRAVAPRELVRRWTAGSHLALVTLEHDETAGVARVVLRRRTAVARRGHALLARARRVLRGIARRARRALGATSRG